MKILQNMWLSKLGCHGKVNVDLHLAATLKFLKFCGHGLFYFEGIRLFSYESLRASVDLNGVK